MLKKKSGNKKMIIARVDKETHRQLRKMAFEEERSIASIVIEAVRKLLTSKR